MKSAPIPALRDDALAGFHFHTNSREKRYSLGCRRFTPPTI